MGIRERRARNDDKLPAKPDFKKQPRDGSNVRGRGGSGARGGNRGSRGGRGGRGGGSSRGRSDRGGPQGGGRGGGRGAPRGRGRGGAKRAFEEPQVKEEPIEEKPMPQWKLKKMAEEEERKKPVVEKSFKVILEGLSKEESTFATIKSLTDAEKITPNKTFIEDKIILEYRQKKHALKACHVLCGLEHNGTQLHAELETKNDLKAHRRTRIIIRNLPWSCNEESLAKLCRQYGHVTEVKIPTKEDGRMRGFGFVQFTHGHESAKAIGGLTEIDGRKVAADWSLPREVYQEIKDKQEPEEQEESEEEEVEEKVSEDDEDEKEEDEMSVDQLSEAKSEDLSEESEEEEEEEVQKLPSKKEKKPQKKNVTGADVLEGRSVFLRNVPFDADEDAITQMCAPYGTVKKVNVVRNPAGGSKGLAFVEYETKEEAEKCVLNTMSLQIDGRNIFARVSLPQTDINSMKKQKEAELKAKPDKRNLTLAREGEIRPGSQAAKGMSEEDAKRRENFGKLKYDKLKNLDNYIDPCKVMVHNIPKAFTEDEIKQLCRKAANGNVFGDVKKNKIMLKSCHLMMDKEDREKSLGYAFATFNSHELALKCLRVLNNHPSVFSNEKRPIVEFAVENAKAVKLLADRRENITKKRKLQEQFGSENKENQVALKKPKKLRPWQKAMEERKRKRRSEARAEGANVDVKIETDEQTQPTPAIPPPPKKAKKQKKAVESKKKADYAGLEVKKGASGKLQRPKHSGAKIRARDKGRLVRESQINKMAKRKKRLAVLGVTAVQKKAKKPESEKVTVKKGPSRKQAKERTSAGGKDFDDLVAAYKQKITAKL